MSTFQRLEYWRSFPLPLYHPSWFSGKCAGRGGQGRVRADVRAGLGATGAGRGSPRVRLTLPPPFFFLSFP